jgi:transcriptional regulatory protein RtcR
MILRAIEDKRFLPVGSDKDVESDFQLLAGTNRDLGRCVAEGTFREDLFARLNLWTFTLPGLAQRPEDIEPNLDYELDRYAEREGERVTFNKEAREASLAFAISPLARWAGNFRDLAASVTRMATFSPRGRIGVDAVATEILRLKTLWEHAGQGAGDGVGPGDDGLDSLFSAAELDQIDLFDRVQLAHVVKVCRASRSLSDAGRTLFAASREKRAKVNDSDRLRKYLDRFGLGWAQVGPPAV